MPPAIKKGTMVTFDFEYFKQHPLLDYVPPHGSVGVVMDGRERQLICDDVVVDWLNWEEYRDHAFYRRQGGIYYNHKELQATNMEDF